uniref:Uncharacterized protein n=1 Tax=Anguilla anguilla TaxID=7936 RepID=A0A0E9TQ07_ANGAN
MALIKKRNTYRSCKMSHFYISFSEEISSSGFVA